MVKGIWKRAGSISGNDNDYRLFLAFFLVVFGLKVMIIANYGSSIPYWDQWDAEADRLYRPFLEGTLQLTDLFAPHNEHRILTTRLLGLALLGLNRGVWDPMVEMYVNAFIHLLALLLLLYHLQKGLDSILKLAFFGFAALFLAVPFGYENTLSGFQAQFYLLMLFSLLLLWSVHLSGIDLQWPRFILVAILAFLSFFSMASGAFSIAAAGTMLLVRRICGVDRKRSSLFLAFLLLLAFAAAVVSTPVLPAHAGLKAKNPVDFALAFLQPTGGVVLYVPLFVFMVRQIKEPPPVGDRSWFVFSLGLWVFGQILAIAYGRAHGVLASRYLDLFAVGILLNAYCLMVLFRQEYCPRFIKPILPIWFFLVVSCLGLFAPTVMKEIAEKKEVTMRNQENVCGYLVTGNVAFIQKEPYSELPYPDVVRLKSLLDNPSISGILTPAVNGRNSNKGLLFYTGRSRKTMSVVGSMLFFYGLFLFMLESFKKADAGYEKEG